MEERAWQVEGLWRKGDRVLLALEPKCGSTWLALSIALAVAAGKSLWSRFKVGEPLPVVFWSGDLDMNYLVERVHTLSDPELVKDNFLASVFAAKSPRTPWDELRRVILDRRPGLVVIDRALPMDDWMNAGRAGGFLANASNVAMEHGCTVVLVHHLRKENGPVAAWKERIRGSSLVAEWPDVCLLTSGPFRSINRRRVDMDVRGRRPLDVRSFSLHVLDPTAPTFHPKMDFVVSAEERAE